MALWCNDWVIIGYDTNGEWADLEGEGQADCVESQKLEAPSHSLKVLGDCAGALPQAVHRSGLGLKSKPAIICMADIRYHSRPKESASRMATPACLSFAAHRA